MNCHCQGGGTAVRRSMKIRNAVNRFVMVMVVYGTPKPMLKYHVLKMEIHRFKK